MSIQFAVSALPSLSPDTRFKQHELPGVAPGSVTGNANARPDCGVRLDVVGW